MEEQEEKQWVAFKPHKNITFEEVVLILESIRLSVDKNNSIVFNDPKYVSVRRHFSE